VSAEIFLSAAFICEQCLLDTVLRDAGNICADMRHTGHTGTLTVAAFHVAIGFAFRIIPFFLILATLGRVAAFTTPCRLRCLGGITTVLPGLLRRARLLEQQQTQYYQSASYYHPASLRAVALFGG